MNPVLEARYNVREWMQPVIFSGNDKTDLNKKRSMRSEVSDHE